MSADNVSSHQTSTIANSKLTLPSPPSEPPSTTRLTYLLVTIIVLIGSVVLFGVGGGFLGGSIGRSGQHAAGLTMICIGALSLGVWGFIAGRRLLGRAQNIKFEGRDEIEMAAPEGPGVDPCEDVGDDKLETLASNSSSSSVQIDEPAVLLSPIQFFLVFVGSVPSYPASTCKSTPLTLSFFWGCITHQPSPSRLSRSPRPNHRRHRPPSNCR